MPKSLKSCANIFSSARGPTGAPWWVSLTTSAWRAGDNIILSRHCLDTMIERAEHGLGPAYRDELWLLHLPIRLGVCAHRGRVGRWLVEAGPWDDTPIARSVRAALKKEPDAWCVSVSYKGDGTPDADGVLNKATLRERSVVTADYALEPWTNISSINRRSNIMSKSIMEILRGLLPDAADELMEQLEGRAAELDAAGVDSRADLVALAAATEEESSARAGVVEAAGEEEKEEEGEDVAEEQEVTLEILAEEVEALQARMEDLQVAVEGLSARMPDTEEMSAEITTALRADLGAELATAIGTLEGLRSLLRPQGRRRDGTAEEDEDADSEAAAAALRKGLDAAEEVDPMNLIYFA